LISLNTMIWTYWECPPGQTQPSELINLCFETMKKHLDPSSFMIVTDKNLFEFLPDIRTDLNKIHVSNIPSQNISLKVDYIRVALLKKFGGLWIDADSIVMGPLDRLFSPIIDFNCRTNNEGICTNGVISSIQNGKIITEYANRQDRRIDASYNMNWCDLGSSMLTPICVDNKPIFRDLGSISPITYRHRDKFFNTDNLEYILDSDICLHYLFNKVFSAMNPPLTKVGLLTGNDLISRLFQKSLL